MSNPKKILVVEDDAPSALLLSQILKKSGYTVLDSVDTGEKAVRVASEFNPDLILMDISIKGDMDGIDAAKMIRDECGIPSIYSTVSTDEKTIKRAKETYPYGYILKPYDKNMIYATVEMALHKIEMERRLGEVERRNRGILDALPDTFFYVNGDGAFADEVEKREASNIWTDKVSSRAVPVIRVVMAGGETEAFEYVLMRGGRKTFCEARIINAGDEKALVIVRDVTTRKTSEETESRYRSDLEESVRSRTRELTEANNSLG
ncbi:MAG: response regulator, partial [Chrysiogenales bacterium]